MFDKAKKALAASIAAVCALSACACGSGVGAGAKPDENNGEDDTQAAATLLAAPSAASSLSYEQNNDPDFVAFKAGVESFAAKFSEVTYGGESYAVSPVSVYMALALSAQCAAGSTKAELLDALGATENGFANNVSMLYRSLAQRYTEHDKNGEKQIGMIDLSNSIWINDGTHVNRPCLEQLAEQYYCYSYYADFDGDNDAANKAVRGFVKDKTKGLIDKDFALSELTLFALINTLYLKDVWNRFGDDMPTTDPVTFTGISSSKEVELLSGYYNDGRALKTDLYSAFYTLTANGNKVKFIVPAAGHTIDEVFTAQNIKAVNSYDFGAGAVDNVGMVKYNTRCLFPQFKAKFDDDIIPVLKTQFDIHDFFNADCDFSTLTDESVYCSKVVHTTDLTVDKKGIEGAAVTVVEMDATAALDDERYTVVNETFTVDKAFGFIITDAFDTTLFSGVVTDL